MTLSADKPYVIPITTNTGVAVVPAFGMNSVGLFMLLTSVASANFIFEASIDSTDGTNGTWFNIPGLRTNGSQLDLTTGVISATPAYGWQFDVACFTFFRVRATAGTFTGNAAQYIYPSDTPNITNLGLSSNGGGSSGALSPFVQGAAVRNSTAPGNPLFVAVGRATNIAAITDARNVELNADLQGKLISKPYSTNELDWQASAASDGASITTTTVTTLKAAIATYRQYVTAIQLHNSAAVATEVVLQDSTGTPVVLWRGYMPASMTSPRDIVFPTPLRTGSGTASAVNLRCVTTGAAIWWSVQGYVAY
jgi:hypothetical protein